MYIYMYMCILACYPSTSMLAGVLKASSVFTIRVWAFEGLRWGDSSREIDLEWGGGGG